MNDLFLSLPENKPKISGKFRTKNEIQNAVFTLLKANCVENIYHDDNWLGVDKIFNLLESNGISCEVLDSSYADQGESKISSLPTKKIYRVSLQVRDREGKNVELFLKILCSFIGKTGTMADKAYRITFKFM